MRNLKSLFIWGPGKALILTFMRKSTKANKVDQESLQSLRSREFEAHHFNRLQKRPLLLGIGPQ